MSSRREKGYIFLVAAGFGGFIAHDTAKTSPSGAYTFGLYLLPVLMLIAGLYYVWLPPKNNKSGQD
jgi:hypothetical protein